MKPGRPKATPGKKLTRIVQARVTAQRYAQLATVKQALGLASPSDVVRVALNHLITKHAQGL